MACWCPCTFWTSSIFSVIMTIISFVIYLNMMRVGMRVDSVYIGSHDTWTGSRKGYFDGRWAEQNEKLTAVFCNVGTVFYQALMTFYIHLLMCTSVVMTFCIHLLMCTSVVMTFCIHLHVLMCASVVMTFCIHLLMCTSVVMTFCIHLLMCTSVVMNFYTTTSNLFFWIVHHDNVVLTRQ